jgi:hypothetical protein
MEQRNAATEGGSSTSITDIAAFTNMSQGVTGDEVYE